MVRRAVHARGVDEIFAADEKAAALRAGADLAAGVRDKVGSAFEVGVGRFRDCCPNRNLKFEKPQKTTKNVTYAS